MHPAVELIDLTGLSTDDERDDGPENAGNSSGEWEDIPTVIDLTNLPSDDEDEAAVEIVSVDHAPAAPTERGQRQRARYRRAETCELCSREARYDRGITRHHLYPQSVVKAAPDAYIPDQKDSIALLCWPCHCAIHRIKTNNELAASFHSVELLKGNAEVQDWIRKMQRATTAELDRPKRKARGLHVASRGSKRRPRFPPRPIAGRPLPSQRPDEDLIHFDGLRRSARLAELGTDAYGNVSDLAVPSASQAHELKQPVMPRQEVYSASQTHCVKKSVMTQKKRNLAKKVEKAARMSQINQALNTLWAQNGNTFPQLFSGAIGKSASLRNAVQSLTRDKDVEVHEVRYVLRSVPEYREWYDWAFAFEPWQTLEANHGAFGLDCAHANGLQGDAGVTQATQGIQSLGVEEGSGDTQATKDPQNPSAQEAEGVNDAIEGILTHGVQESDRGIPIMGGMQTHQEDNQDRQAPVSWFRNIISALEQIGEYIPL